MTILPNPTWSNHSLQRHFIKRRTIDRACWEEILKHSAPMTEKEYENTSYDAYRRAIIEYDAEERGYPRCVHRFDARAIRTIANEDRSKMITCFHFHKGNRHFPGSLAIPLGDKCGEFLDNLEERADAEELRLFDIKIQKKYVPNGKLRSKSGPLIKKINALKIRCVSL